MARSGAIAQLFLLIRSCNRSLPCMEVVSYAVQVLLHVAKVGAAAPGVSASPSADARLSPRPPSPPRLLQYERTAAAVCAVDGGVDTLLGLLRVYRERPGDRLADKSGGIFTRTCCLLAVLLRAAGRAPVSGRCPSVRHPGSLSPGGWGGKGPAWGVLVGQEVGLGGAVGD